MWECAKLKGFSVSLHKTSIATAKFLGGCNLPSKWAFTMARGNNLLQKGTNLKEFEVKLGYSITITKLLQGGQLKSLLFGAMLK